MKSLRYALLVLTSILLFSCSKEDTEPNEQNYFKGKWKADIEKRVEEPLNPASIVRLYPFEDTFNITLLDSGKVENEQRFVTLNPFNSKDIQSGWLFEPETNELSFIKGQGLLYKYVIASKDRNTASFAATLVNTNFSGSVYRFTKIQ